MNEPPRMPTNQSSRMRRPDEAAFNRLYRQNEQCRSEVARLRIQSDRLFVALATLLAFCAEHERNSLLYDDRPVWRAAPTGDPITAAKIVIKDVLAAAAQQAPTS